MAIDTNRVKEIFLEAAELADEEARTACLDKACQGDADLRERVAALLRAHDPQGSFLNTPAAVVPDPAHAPTRDYAFDPARTNDGGMGASADEALTFLAPPTRPDSLGRIGHYEVLQVLGRGAFGIVFRAFDDVLQRVVAVKVLAPQVAATSPARKRFLREARSSAQVRHENVVQVYDVGEEPLPYLVMEFIPGETLQQRLDRVGPLDVLETLRIGRQVAQGLAAAHHHDLIHRDIKPGNILLETGEHGHAKITDFGLARAADDASISQSGIIAGTPMYMAPEQAQGHSLDQRADLFSLGSVLYQMVTGRPPFRANTTFAVLKRVAEDTPRPIREIIPETPSWLCDIIAKLHAKNPDERFQSAREVADLLTDCEAQLKANSKLKDYSRIPQNKPPQSRRWEWLIVAAVLVPVIVLFALKFAGVTPLFREEPVTHNPVKPDGESPTPAADGWVQLFNGKDLAGWKTHPDQPGQWKVEGGVLVGSAMPSYLYSNAGNFRDFHLRVEAKINKGGDSGIFFRAPFATRHGRTANQRRPAGGYEVELHENPTHSARTGSIWDAETDSAPKALWTTKHVALTRPDEWFTLEIIVQGNHIISKVNGTTTADCLDPRAHYDEGHFALQVFSPQTVVQFRKIEVKELPRDLVAQQEPPLAVVPFDAAQAKQHQEAWARHLGVPVEVTDPAGMRMRLIPPGEFLMGTPEADMPTLREEARVFDEHWRVSLEGESPPQAVRLTRPYRIGATEVTRGQFRRFVTSTGYKTDIERGIIKGEIYVDGKAINGAGYTWDADLGIPGTDDHPVVCVTWNDAAAYCAWLSKVTGRTYRLPTEAEWEFACRAGTTTRYSYGDAFDDAYLWRSEETGLSGTAPGHKPVGGKRPNAFGLYDMHDNVQEWCQDRYAPFAKSALRINPVGQAAGNRQVARGGSWISGFETHRTAARYGVPAMQASSNHGFRVVMVGDLAPSPVAPLKSGDPEYTNTLGMKFKLIPAGRFMMGSSQEEIDRALKLVDQGRWEKDQIPTEGPRHDVELTQPVYLGATEVTVGQFRQFVAANPTYNVGDERWQKPGFDQSDDHPVVWVSWQNAVDFCEWLSKKEGRKYRLPTEAEWEYSCRAGKAGTRDRFGDEDGALEQYAWYNGNSGGTPKPVGKKQPNAWGLHDMHGNVWEWCQDIYDPNYYKNSPPQDPSGGAGDIRVARGGSCQYSPVICRSAFRGGNAPDYRDENIGFRVLLVAPQGSAPTGTGAKDKSPLTDTDAKRLAAPPAAIAPFDADQAKKHQDDWAKYLGVPVEISSPTQGHKLRLIPPGTFRMGADSDDGPAPRKGRYDQPQHEVTLTRPFYLSTREVTQGQFRQFVQETGYTTKAEVGDRGAWRPVPGPRTGMGLGPKPGLNWKTRPDKTQTDDYPVSCLAWEDAVAYCAWLSKKEGKVCRLPTEAEWEYACRAGTTTPFSFGNTLDKQHANLAQEYHKLLAVGSLSPNSFGIHDMHGNVAEWCLDAPRSYGPAPATDPLGTGSQRVYRGGDWFGVHTNGSSSARHLSPSNLPDGYTPANVPIVNNGFRVLVELPLKPAP